MSRWELTEAVKEKYVPIVERYIKEIEEEEFPEDIEALDFSDTELNPYTLWKLLEGLGYKHDDTDQNGWEMDFWLSFKKDGHKTLTIKGTGITFSLKLTIRQ